ncbi:MAG TPA: CRISPR-associated endonuclease Cas3'', partial [Isosphaeraceae bacterium]|nr:CRISPR-associated endonuclease Cas3'' [Isosphaeraceae bacterium]
MAKPSRSLVDHTADVVTAFVALFGTEENPNDFTRRWLAFFRLNEGDLTPFLRNAQLACWVHDWGKANTGFAGMLARTAVQAVRHEVVSALIMTQPQVWRWLENAERVDLPLVLAAVAGHHLKAAEPEGWGDAKQFGTNQAGALNSDFALTWNHPKIRDQIALLAKEFGIEGPLPDGVLEDWSSGRRGPNTAHYPDERARACKRIKQFLREIEDDHASNGSRILRAVRSALIAADSAGSALFRTHEETGRTDEVRPHIRQWIADAFDPAARLDGAKVH